MNEPPVLGVRLIPQMAIEGSLDDIDSYDVGCHRISLIP